MNESHSFDSLTAFVDEGVWSDGANPEKVATAGKTRLLADRLDFQPNLSFLIMIVMIAMMMMTMVTIKMMMMTMVMIAMITKMKIIAAMRVKKIFKLNSTLDLM